MTSSGRHDGSRLPHDDLSDQPVLMPLGGHSARVQVPGGAVVVEELGSGDPPVVLIHGIACNRRFLSPQFDHLAQRHRTLAIDLPGHGESEAPVREYTIQGYAAELARLCDLLAIDRPVLVGHSLGGLVALEAAPAARAVAVVVIDSPLVPPPGREARMRALFGRLRGDQYDEAVIEYFEAFFRDDRPEFREPVLTEVVRAPRHAVISAWENGAQAFDSAAALERCRVPVLYLDADTPNADLARAHAISPLLEAERITGAGHFVQLEEPARVNAAIDRFVRRSAG